MKSKQQDIEYLRQALVKKYEAMFFKEIPIKKEEPKKEPETPPNTPETLSRTINLNKETKCQLKK